ncbi:MAG: glycosyltransferase [Enterococcus sp.]
MIKVLHVLGSLDTGGAETAILNLYRNINSEIYEFSFVVHGPHIGVYEQILKKEGIKVYHAPRYTIYNHAQYIKYWDNLFENNSYDIIHAHMRSTAKIYTRIAKENSLKTIVHSHSSSENKGIKGFIQKYWYQRNIDKFSDLNLAVSDSAGKYLFKNKKFDVVVSGIDYSKFQYNEKYAKKLKDSYELTNSIVLGTIGRIEPVKNHQFLLKIIEKLDKKYKLVIIGEGSRKKQLIKEIKKRGLESRVVIINPKMDIYKYYSMFDIFMFPSLKEGLGNVGIEAQINGLSVVCSTGVPKDIKISDNIYFLSTKNTNHWLDVINANLRKKNIQLDLNLKFNIEETVEEYEKIYSFMMNESGD